MKDLIKRLLETNKVDAETAETLNNEVTELDNKLKAARDESIERRKKLKDSELQIEATQKKYRDVLEQLGIDADEDVDLQAISAKAKGKTEADTQLQLKIKRLEKDIVKVNEDKQAIQGKHHDSLKQAALSKALNKHEWIDSELVEQVLSHQIEVTEDGVFMSDGLSIDDGIAQYAAKKPHLIKAKGQGGSGYKSKDNQGKTNPFAKDTFNLTAQAALLKNNPELAKQMQTGA